MKYFLSFFILISSFMARGQQEIDPSRWQAVGSRLVNIIVIGLGETGHGYESINEAKSVTAAFLHSQLNFRVISFESSFVESLMGFLRKDSLDKRMAGFLYPFWNTGSINTMLNHFVEEERQTDRPLIMGFDLQEDCRFMKFSTFLLKEGLVVAGKEKLMECDSILSLYIGANSSKKGAMTEAEYKILSGNYNIIRTELKARNLADLNAKLLDRAIENREWLCRYLTFSTAREKMYFRDSLMAKNITWMKQEIYSDQKMIVWAANSHIARKEANKDPRWMGEWLSGSLAGGYFAIAFEKGRPGKGSHILTTEISIGFSDADGKKFDAIVNSGKLRKIRPDQWTTPCE
jgi:erythromycin esterase